MTEIPVLVPLDAQAGSPVTLEQLKAHLEIVEDDWDALLAEQLKAAVAYCEARSGLVAAPQRFQLRLDVWPSGSEIEIPVFPVRDIESVTYVDTDGIERTVPESDWSFELTPEGAILQFLSGFSAPDLRSNRRGVVRVNIAAGFDAVGEGTGTGDAAHLVVPELLRHAVKTVAAHYFNNREAISDVAMLPVPMSADNQLDLIRIYR